LAVDRARPGRLKALAVLAFWAEITRLPGHWSPRSSPLKHTTATTPSRSTTVAHMWRPKPSPSATTAWRAVRTSSWVGSSAALAATARLRAAMMVQLRMVGLLAPFGWKQPVVGTSRWISRASSWKDGTGYIEVCGEHVQRPSIVARLPGTVELQLGHDRPDDTSKQAVSHRAS